MLRYISRLIVVTTESGKVRLRYGHPLANGKNYRLLSFTGPEPVMPPDREFTEEELKHWKLAQPGGSGCGDGGRPLKITEKTGYIPLIEVQQTLEDQIPKGVVKWKLVWTEWPATGEPTLGAVLRSDWDEKIPNFNLSADYTHEAPQPAEGVPGRFKALVAGDSLRCFQRLTLLGEEGLPPRTDVGFAFDPQFVPDLQSRAVSLSVESHWIALLTDGQAFDRIPGSAVAAFLETSPPDLEG